MRCWVNQWTRIKARRGHKKAIIAICRMLLTAIWNMLSKLLPYSSNGFLEPIHPYPNKTLTVSQAPHLLRLKGFCIQDDAPALTSG
jgi:transposase